ncbi:MAG: HmuY family protein [Bacteroidales bacterium]|jgi:hypothetical protein|nr:HmuY family protein [Bacteroidales bacterium]
MKKTLLLLTVTFLALSIFTSCDKDDDPKPATGDTVEIDVASSWATWNYFSFSTGEIVGTGSANAEDDAEWKARTDWDIAFTRLYARTNSGISGSGNGGVIEIGTDNSDKAAVFANLIDAPASGYIADEEINELMIGMNPATGPVTYNAGGSAKISSWLTMSMPVVATPKVFALKTADGKYAKIYLKGYQNDEGQSNVVVMEYVYQADGSTNLSTSN